MRALRLLRRGRQRGGGAELARNLAAYRKRDLAAAKLAATNFVPYLERQDLSQRFMHAPGAPRN